MMINNRYRSGISSKLSNNIITITSTNTLLRLDKSHGNDLITKALSEMEIVPEVIDADNAYTYGTGYKWEITLNKEDILFYHLQGRNLEKEFEHKLHRLYAEFADHFVRQLNTSVKSTGVK